MDKIIHIALLTYPQKPYHRKGNPQQHMKVKMTELRTKIIDTLKNATEPMTLSEISTAISADVKTGTTNSLVSAGLVRKVGTKKVAKVVYVEVATYEIGDTSSLDVGVVGVTDENIAFGDKPTEGVVVVAEDK